MNSSKSIFVAVNHLITSLSYLAVISLKSPQDIVTYCWRNEKTKDEAIKYIKNLPFIYNKIAFSELESQTKLQVNEIRQIIDLLNVNFQKDSFIDFVIKLYKEILR